VLQSCVDEIKLTQLYPRFDATVSKFKNHLLKAPYSIHPKTGYICIPVDPATLDWTLPPEWTAESLLLEVNDAVAIDEPAIQLGSGRWEMTRMAESVSYMKALTRSLEVDLVRLSSRHT
jgi:DNA primase small subunit